MNRNQNATIQKWLLIFTVLTVAAFIFTFPTRDRRGTIDRIRMKVGAEHLVSKNTLKEIQAEEVAAGKRKPGPTAKLDRKALARGKNSPAEVKARFEKYVSHYCNKDYDATACAQWLNSCGQSCRLLVRQDLWSKMTGRKPASAMKTAARGRR